MKKSLGMKAFAIALMAAVVFSFVGCSGSVKESDVSYAGPALDNVLAGIKDNDYAMFSKDFEDNLKNQITEDSFHTLASSLQTQIGDYQSRTYAGAVASTQNNVQYMTVLYKAKYTKADVQITIAFSGNNGAYKVSGLWFK